LPEKATTLVTRVGRKNRRKVAGSAPKDEPMLRGLEERNERREAKSIAIAQLYRGGRQKGEKAQAI